MSASKLQLTRAAGLLAVAIACAALAAGPAHAQAAQPSPVAEQAGKAKPKASTQRGVVKKKSRVSRRADAARKPSLARKQRPGKAAAAAKVPTKKALTKKAPLTARSARAAVAAPPPVARTLPPLGPERFYPDGIPELHPAFMHPLPGTPVLSERAAVSRAPGAEPEWLP
ncbi:hypothetical protein [Ramlibacter sp.]|uniref:hypothetical protein n=1 Tax=Ramlibacter sp. TaxID=1917967 RepID=UPI002D3D1F69|nr:hypothetical protein [Ramlibacter sp.]HYD77313.1 hypothetical protein [Ramlibacter sp.]